MTGIPPCVLDFKANFRMEMHTQCIQILNEKLKSAVASEEKNLLMKSLGIASFNVYDRRRNAGEINVSCFDHAKQATSCLGAAYDNNCFPDRSPEAEMMDFTMTDIIAKQNKLKLKPLIRCLLCKKKCQKGEKIIKSHIWPNSCLRGFTRFAPNAPDSMRIFDSTQSNYGTLLGPGQTAYPMLCKKCENFISEFENLFKSKFFDVVL